MTLELDAHRHVHFVGIGGIGMSALAKILLARGFTVSGFDQSGGDQVDILRSSGARVDVGESTGALLGADLVVITPAAAGSDDVQSARTRGIPVVRRAELLGALMNPMYGIAVAGTHGKSTTSALIAHLCVEAGFDPSAIIGAVVDSFGSNARMGRGDIVVVEADEFDSAFLELWPASAVITSVEPEHLDYFGDAERMFEAFAQFATQVRDTLFICADDAPVERITGRAGCEVVTYGINGGDWRATDIEDRGGRTHFRVRRAGTEERAYVTSLAGAHNVRNALAGIAVGHALRIDPATIAQALAGFSGTERRCQTIGTVDDIIVVDDYGHHPTEIRTTLAALRTRFRRPIRVVFQPHTYSRTKTFLQDFAVAFAHADAVYILDIYGARERDTLGISGSDLASAVARHHPSVVYTGSKEAAVDGVSGDAHSGDLIVTMGAGDVSLLAPMILQRLRERAAVTL